MKSTMKSLVLAAALMVPSVALAGGGECGGRRGAMHEKITQNAAELGLSPQQVQAIKDIGTRAAPEMKALKERMRAARERGDQAEIQAAGQAMAAKRKAVKEQIDAQLTEQQKQKLQEKRDRRGPRPTQNG